MKKYFLVFLMPVLLTSCLRLDDNLFNPDAGITEYKYDKFEGEVDFILDASYDIPANLVHEFTLNSGEKEIYAIYLGNVANIATDTVIMYCHGNKWHMDFYWQRAKLLAHTGHKNRFGLLMIDYGGFGLSEGPASENRLYEDVETALKWLSGKGLSGERLVMYGFSLGAAPAIKLSANPQTLKPWKLIAEAPFASASVMVQDASVLAMPSSFYVNVEVNNAEEIKKVQQPFMWIHGIDDSFLSIDTHGEVVYKNHSGAFGESHKIAGGEHGDVPLIWGFENYTEAIKEFIEK